MIQKWQFLCDCREPRHRANAHHNEMEALLRALVPQSPTQRALSYVFYISSNRGLNMDDANVIRMLNYKNQGSRVDKRESQVGFRLPSWIPSHWATSRLTFYGTARDLVVSPTYPLYSRGFMIFWSSMIFYWWWIVWTSHLLPCNSYLILIHEPYCTFSVARKAVETGLLPSKLVNFISKTISRCQGHLESPEWLAWNYGDYLLVVPCRKSKLGCHH